MVFSAGQLIEIVVNNHDSGIHVMHVHGYTPQLVARYPPFISNVPRGHRRREAHRPVGLPDEISAAPFAGPTVYPKIPIRRDSWVLGPYGTTTVRFVADNPGVWLLHCHMEWHVEAGMTMTLIDSPDQIQAIQKFPEEMEEICQNQGILTKGNAAGRTDDQVYDVDGQITVCPRNPMGALIQSSSSYHLA